MEWIEAFTFFSLFNKESAPKKKDTEADVLEQVVVEKDLKASSDVATVTLEKKESKVNSLLKKKKVTKEHPCAVVPHVNPLNLLHPDKLKDTPRDCQHVIQAYQAGQKLDELLLPVHKDIVSGVTDTGLSYVILPAKAPAGRFEAHLQIYSGSCDELEPQQGIAHLTEHVAYMGSRKRERLFGTGSQTNAYTDFHHTVFYACCPCHSPSTKVPMLPYALDALSDVMEAESTKSRLEKERSAVLSEMTMVNTIEYRVECQILGTLHAENRLASRFPIGKEHLIRSWQRDDVLRWHRTHYRPDNAMLYIVGDVEPEEAIKTINSKFGHITATKQASIMTEPHKEAAGELMKRIVDEKTVSYLPTFAPVDIVLTLLFMLNEIGQS